VGSLVFSAQTRSHSMKNVADAKLENTSLSADVFQRSSQEIQDCPHCVTLKYKTKLKYNFINIALTVLVITA